MRFSQGKDRSYKSRQEGLFFFTLFGVGKAITCGAIHWLSMLKNK